MTLVWLTVVLCGVALLLHFGAALYRVYLRRQERLPKRGEETTMAAIELLRWKRKVDALWVYRQANPEYTFAEASKRLRQEYDAIDDKVGFHFSLPSHQLDADLSFFVDDLGAEIITENELGVAINIGETKLTLHRATLAAEMPFDFHIGIIVSNVRFQELSKSLTGVEHRNKEQFFVRSPSGFLFEVATHSGKELRLC